MSNITIDILKNMSKFQANIETSEDSITIIRGAQPSKTTSHKVELIAKFLSAKGNEILQKEEGPSLLLALKDKLIREADGNDEIIQKIKELSCREVGGNAPDILIVRSQAPETAKQFLKNMDLFVKHFPKYFLGNEMEVIEFSENLLPKGWEPEKLLSQFRMTCAKFSKFLNFEQIDRLEKNVAPLIKPISVVKFGLIFESKDQLANDAMVMNAKKLLMHSTPVIVNRDFMLAHRYSFFDFQVPLQWYHQKGGNYCLIVPEKGKSPRYLGFNENELVLGSFKELLPCEQEEINALDRLFLTETTEKRFLRLGSFAGHGSAEGAIAGLSFDQFSNIQEMLHSKGLKFGILMSCFSGGANLEVIQKTPYPLMILSSSETSSIENMTDPTMNGILEYAKDHLQKGPLGVLIPQEIPLEMEALLAEERVSDIFTSLRKENLPTFVLPKINKSIGLKEFQGLKRLEERVIVEPIVFGSEESSGFNLGGGTGHHILKEVISETVPLETIVDNTLKLLDLSSSSTKKGIFIHQMQESSHSEPIETLALFISKEEIGYHFRPSGQEKYEVFYKNHLSGKWVKTDPFEELQALTLQYTYFVKTLPKGKEGELQFLDFQKNFFGNKDLPFIHGVFALLVQAYCYEERREEILNQFQEQITKLSQKEISGVETCAGLLGLHSFKNPKVVPELIQKLRQVGELETLEFLKRRLTEVENPFLFLSEQDSQGHSALSWAVHLQKRAVTEFIIQETTAKQISYWDRNAFFEACRLGDRELAKKIVKVGGSETLDPETVAFILPQASEKVVPFLIESLPPLKDNSGLQVISQLIQNSQYELLEQILKPPNEEISKEFLSFFLLLALSKTDKKCMEILLSSGADPNCPEFVKKNFLLIYACMASPSQEQIEIAELLIKGGANVDIIGPDKETPLLIALATKNYPLLKCLLKNGVSFNSEFGRACLDKEVMKCVLENSTKEQLEKNDPHPLVIALAAQDFKLATALIQKGVRSKDLIFNYLLTVKHNADIKTLEWIISSEDLFQPTEENLRDFAGNVSRCAPLEVNIYFKELFKKKFNYNEPNYTPYLFLNSTILQKSLFDSTLTLAKLPSDQAVHAESMKGSRESIEKMVRYAIDQIDNFEEDIFLHYLSQFLQKDDFELRLYFLNAVIEKSPFKPFYKALQEENVALVQELAEKFTDEEIAKIWKYCPPPAILTTKRTFPSKELLQAVKKQMEKASLDQMKEDQRLLILDMMGYLTKSI